MDKRKVLAKYLDCEIDNLDQSSYDENLFEFGLESYLVLDNEEADMYVRDRILDSLWAFNADFILSHSRIQIDEAILNALKMMQEKLCENGNSLVRALIEDEEQFIDDAVDDLGRGHFLAGYDDEEHEVDNFFIYRQN